MSDHKFIRRIKLLNSYWANDPNLKFASFREKDLRPIQLKALIKYSFDIDINVEKIFEEKPPSCNSKEECNQKIQAHEKLFLSNNDKEVLSIIPQQAKKREPNLKDKWISITRTETYVEDCSNCKGKGDIHCTTCSNCSGLPTGKTKCLHCEGSCSIDCPACEGNNKSCLVCEGKGKRKCGHCSGTGHSTCHNCNGELKVICPECNGYEKAIFEYNIDLNIVSETNLSWEENTTPDWMNQYLQKEISEEPTSISLMKYADWHSHTFNLANFEKEQFFASIQGNIEPYELTYILNDGKEIECKFIHSTLVPYDLNYIFDDYMNTLCDNLMNKNNFKIQKEFFENKTVESIINEKKECIPIETKMIKHSTKEKIKKTFKSFSEAHLEEKENIDIRDIATWTGFSYLLIFTSMFLLSSFSLQNIDWSLISFPNIISNFSNAIISIPDLLQHHLKESSIFIIFMIAISYGIQKILGSSKKCIFRYFGWLFNLTTITYLTGFNLYPELVDIEWTFSFTHYLSSFISTCDIWFDVLLFSLLIGIFKARNINCFKMKKIAILLNNKNLKKKLCF